MTKKTMQNIKAMEETSVVNLPLSKVIADSDFNIRQSKVGMKEKGDESIESLARSIKEEGQQTPVSVREADDGFYRLIYGFRRYAALEKLGAESIRAQVLPASEDLEADSLEDFLLNLSENLNREAVGGYDLAMRLRMLRDTYGMTGSQLARRIGRSKGYVNNLLRIVDNLDSRIIEEWRKGSAGKSASEEEKSTIPIDKLAKWAKYNPEEQWDAFLTETGRKEETEVEEGEEASEEAPTAVKRASKKVLEAAMAAVAASDKISGNAEKAMRSALQFALGLKGKLMFGRSVVFDPEAKEGSSSNPTIPEAPEE